MKSIYEQMIEMNQALIHGKSVSREQKDAYVKAVLSESRTDTVTSGRRLYPECIPFPKAMFGQIQTVMGQKPHTLILAANMYELEILRLLFLFDPESDKVQELIRHTLNRLQDTCFGYQDDGKGECFDASLVVLRFLITVCPDDKEWIQSRIDNYNRHKDDTKRSRYAQRYFELCMTELERVG